MDYIMSLIDLASNAIAGYEVQITATIIIILFQILLIKLLLPIIDRAIVNSRLKEDSHHKARTSVMLIQFSITFSLITLIWGFDIRGLMTVSTGAITLLGASLFASWSILSNVTTFFIIIFHISYKRGNYIRILAGENYIEGYISEINLFNTKLVTVNKQNIVVPNNTIILNPVIINPREYLPSIGKIAEFNQKDKA